MTTVRFMWGGRGHILSAEDVTARLKGAHFGAVKTHAVDVEGALYPVKEAMAFLTGEDVLDFNTNQARSVFRKLGFTVKRVT